MEQNMCLVIHLAKIFSSNGLLLNVDPMLKDVNQIIIKGSHNFILKKMKIFFKRACYVLIHDLELNYWNESKIYI